MAGSTTVRGIIVSKGMLRRGNPAGGMYIAFPGYRRCTVTTVGTGLFVGIVFAEEQLHRYFAIGVQIFVCKGSIHSNQITVAVAAVHGAKMAGMFTRKPLGTAFRTMAGGAIQGILRGPAYIFAAVAVHRGAPGGIQVVCRSVYPQGPQA